LFDDEYKQRSCKIHNRNGQTSAMNRENMINIGVNHLINWFNVVRICGWSKSLIVEIEKLELLVVWFNEEILIDRSEIKMQINWDEINFTYIHNGFSRVDIRWQSTKRTKTNKNCCIAWWTNEFILATSSFAFIFVSIDYSYVVWKSLSVSKSIRNITIN